MVREGKSSAIEFDTSAPGRREGRYLLLPARLESSATVVMRELCPSNSSPSFFCAWTARISEPSRSVCDTVINRSCNCFVLHGLRIL